MRTLASIRRHGLPLCASLAARGPALCGAECRSNPSMLVCGLDIALQGSTPGPAGRLGNAGKLRASGLKDTRHAWASKAGPQPRRGAMLCVASMRFVHGDARAGLLLIYGDACSAALYLSAFTPPRLRPSFACPGMPSVLPAASLRGIQRSLAVRLDRASTPGELCQARTLAY